MSFGDQATTQTEHLLAEIKRLTVALEKAAVNNHLARHAHTNLSAAQWRQCPEVSCKDAAAEIPR